MKDWEVVADNLKKAGWSVGWVSALDLEGARSGWLTRIATESVSLFTPMKS